MNEKVTFDEYVEVYYGKGIINRGDINAIGVIGEHTIFRTPGNLEVYNRVFKVIEKRIDELCREPKQLIREEKIVLPAVLGIGNICPKCGSHQFSISVPEQGERPVDWPANVLGSADCGGCYGDFLVTFAPELERAVYFLLRSKKIGHVETNIALKAMFPNSQSSS